MYKFNDTSFKTYFVFSTNCVKLVDHIIRSVGIDAVNSKGIITPGGFYDFFDYQFSLDQSIIVSKQTYHYKGYVNDISNKKR